MHEFTITIPKYLEGEIKTLADKIGVSVEMLIAFLFAKEVVHA